MRETIHRLEIFHIRTKWKEKTRKKALFMAHPAFAIKGGKT
jgi:hypothetical protein